MTHSAGTKLGIAGIVAIPAFAIIPPVVVMLLRIHSNVDYFYFSVAGVILSLYLAITAAIKARWWWIFSPLPGIAVTAIAYVMITRALGMRP